MTPLHQLLFHHSVSSGIAEIPTTGYILTKERNILLFVGFAFIELMGSKLRLPEISRVSRLSFLRLVCQKLLLYTVSVYSYMVVT